MIRSFLIYAGKFLAIFCFLYFGTQALIGLTIPDHHYSSFVSEYLDFVSALRRSLLVTSKMIVGILGYPAQIISSFRLKITGGSSVRMVYSCLGIGVFSFWAAFVIANNGSFFKKLIWLVSGFVLIWLINITRICLLLIATNDHWPSTFKMNHHTFFNIAAYGAIFVMMLYFDKSQIKILQQKANWNDI